MRVGADVRICSLHASSQLRPSGRLHAFEPTRKTFDLLISNIKRAGSIIYPRQQAGFRGEEWNAVSYG